MNLHAYKFETVVPENGMIEIPYFKSHVNEEIEVFIVIKKPPKNKQTKQAKPRLTAEEFIEKWAGAFSVFDVNDAKYEYLMEKYK